MKYTFLFSLLPVPVKARALHNLFLICHLKITTFGEVREVKIPSVEFSPTGSGIIQFLQVRVLRNAELNLHPVTALTAYFARIDVTARVLERDPKTSRPVSMRAPLQLTVCCCEGSPYEY